ncbi:MAG: hypothetical protein WCB12_16850 [Bryobacteraceae bacterium]
MRLGLQIVALAVGLPLQFLVVAALLRGAWRRFPWVLAFSVVELVYALALAPSALEWMHGIHTPGVPYWVTFWFGGAITQLLLYAVVISFLYRAADRLRSARVARVLLILVACLVAGGTFLAHYDPSIQRGEWLTPWFRDLNFACALMDIVLWTSLLAARDRDRQLLMLSGGLGVQFAGAAIGESLRQMAMQSRSHRLALAGAVIIVSANLFRFYVWWHALRHRQPEENTPVTLQPVRQRGDSL